MLIPTIQLDLWQSFSRLKGFSLAFPRICISCSSTLQWLFQALYWRISGKQTLLTAALVEPLTELGSVLWMLKVVSR